MRTKITFLLPLFSLATSFLFSQTTHDKVVPLAAVVQANPPQVELTWSSPALMSDILLFRREKGATDWEVLLTDSGTSQLTYTDTALVTGKIYEYGIQRYTGNIYAYGYLGVALETPPVDHRGTMLVFVEEALEAPLAAELQRLQTDLNGDGWKVIWHTVAPGDDVASVKTQIVTDYNADIQQVKSVFLLGEIPVPYSGNFAWDGHDDHEGAWPADTYYGDVDVAWSDNLVDNTAPARPENDNVPGDGKFDPSVTPSPVELAVGRVDFSNLSETTFGATKTELYRRYLNKNHNWRNKQYTVPNKALVDDNFGYFGGEAFAGSGYRNGNALVGEANVVDGDFLDDTDTQGFLLGYGCGPGGYAEAAGVGNSAQFATDSINVAFSMIFGSYHGDWDYAPNPLMPSMLASKGGILSVSWAGRPHWFYHHMAAGETLGYSALETQNACDNAGYFGSLGECGAHVTLLGDPSLRAQIVAPPDHLMAFQACNTIELVWDPSPQPEVVGYHVYRAMELNGDYTRLTEDPVNGISFIDTFPPDGSLHYQVRAVALEETPGGSFYNTSTGIFQNFDFTALPPLDIAITGEGISCLNPEVTLLASTNAQAPLSIWTGPGGFESYDEEITVSITGEYTLYVTDLVTGCMGSGTFTVADDTAPPANVTAGLDQVNCANQTAQLSGASVTAGVTFAWAGPNGFSSNEQNPAVQEQGLYNLTATNPANGCTSSATYELTANLSAPEAFAQGGELTCNVTVLELQGASNITNVAYAWTGPGGFSSSLQNPAVSAPGDYTLIVTDTSNGCTGALTVVVTQSGDLPEAFPVAGGVLTCIVEEVTLLANPGMPGYTFLWTGPGGFVSNEENPVVQSPGTYQLIVADPVTGCSATFQTTVSETILTPVITISPSTIELNCNVTSFVLDCPISIPEILCQWLDENGNLIPPGTPVTQPGAYILTLTEMNSGCSASDTLTVVENNDIPDLTVSGDLQLACADGTTVLTAESTAPDAVYHWTGGTFANPNLPQQEVGPGTYTVVVTALNTGCTNSEIVEVTAPPALMAEVFPSFDCDGNVYFPLSIQGGTPPYAFVIQPPPPFPSGTTVSITITDAAGCVLELDDFTYTFPAPLSLAIGVTHETIAGANDGSATVQPNGGTAPYQYLWSNGQTSATAADLAPGEYTVVVIDANGCTQTGGVTILAGISATGEVEGLLNLALSPNPASSFFSLELVLNQPKTVQVEVMDITGHILQKTAHETLIEKTWTFDLSGYPAGVYVCKINVNGQVTARRVVKAG